MHEHTRCMRSLLVLQLSLMNITPVTFSCLHVILILISLHIIHIDISWRGYVSCNLPYFMSYNSCNYIQIFIQTSHNRSRATHRHMHNISHQLSSIHNIHSRSHDFVFKHIKLAYNLMTRAYPRARANIQQIMHNLQRVSHLPG